MQILNQWTEKLWKMQSTAKLFTSILSDLSNAKVDNYRPWSEGDNALGSVLPSVCPFVCAQSFDLRPSSFAWKSTLTLARLAMKVKVVGQRSRSRAKNCVFTWLLPCFKVRIKGRGQGQRSGSRSWVTVMGQGQGAQQSIGARLCRVQQTAIGVITSLCVCDKWVCADNRTDAVDWFSITKWTIQYNNDKCKWICYGQKPIEIETHSLHLWKQDPVSLAVIIRVA